MRSKRHDMAIGAFVLIALVVSGALIMKFGGFDKRKKTYQITVLFSDVVGLIKDAPVYYAGVECGKVDEIIAPSPGYPKVQVVLNVNEDTTIRNQDVITISSISIIGDKIVKIIPGEFSAPVVAPNSRIIGRDPFDPWSSFEEATKVLVSPEFQQDLKRIVQGLADLVNEQNRERFSLAIRNLLLASQSLIDDLQNLRDILNDDTKDSIKSIIASAERIIDNVEAASDDLPELSRLLTKFIGDNAGNIEDLIVSVKGASDDLSGFLRSMRGFVREIGRGEGTIGKLIYDSDLYDNLNAVVEGIKFYGLLKFNEKLYEQELERRTEEEPWNR